jgi:hypothetical protein
MVNFEKIPDKEKAKRLQKEYYERSEERECLEDLQKSLNLEYRYFRFWFNGDREISISVGWKRIVYDFDVDSIRYSIALQSKKDSFSRKEARKHINKRFNEGFSAEIPIANGIRNRNIDQLIAWHYNTHHVPWEDYGLRANIVPKYLRNIPIYF